MTNDISKYVDDNEKGKEVKEDGNLASLIVFDEFNIQTQTAITPGVGFDVDNIVKDYVEGHSRKYIQLKYGISNGQLSSHLSARDIPLRYPGRSESTLGKRLSHLSERDMQNIINDYSEGMSTKEIYTKYSIHKNGLYSILDANQVRRKRGE